MKNYKIVAIAFFLSVFFCIPATAQKQTPQQRQKAQKEAQERAQRLADEEAVRKMPDPGADMAFVVAAKANIREEPNRTSPIVKEVSRGEALSLIEREPTGTWYRVIHVDSAIEGWIDPSVVVNKFTANRYTAPEFQEEESEVYENPKVKNYQSRALHRFESQDERSSIRHKSRHHANICTSAWPLRILRMVSRRSRHIW